MAIICAIPYLMYC